MGAMALPGSGHAGLAPRNEDEFAGTPYREIRRLGSGGMSDVFIVAHRDLEKEFVAKVLRAELAKDAQTLDRVRIEAQALGRLSHANVVSVSDVRSLRDGRPFIVMEHLRGHSLSAELAARKPLPIREAIGFASELLSALAAVHETGIVHRDIKPSNLFLCDLPSGKRTLKVIDFGIARVLPGAPPSAPSPLSVPTATGAVVGTPRYISPEGAAGEHVDHRADLYGAALVLYAMLTGRGPFDHLRDSDLLSAKGMEHPEAPSRFARESVPAELDTLVLKALRRDPDERFQTANEFRAALARVENTLPSVESGRGFDRTVEDANIETRTANPELIPAAAKQRLSPSVKRLAAASAFLFITALTFAMGVGLVRIVQAYLTRG